MKFSLIIIIAIFLTSCSEKTSLDITILETGSEIPVVDAKVDLFQLTYGGVLGMPSISKELLETIYTDSNGSFSFDTRMEFDAIELEISKAGYFPIDPDMDIRNGTFTLNQGDDVSRIFEMDPAGELEFRIIDSPSINETGIILNTLFLGASQEFYNIDTSFTGIVRGNNFHIYGYKFGNSSGNLTSDSIYIDKNQQATVELTF